MNEPFGEHIVLDDGTDVMEDHFIIVGIERGGEDGLAAALDVDVKGIRVRGDGDFRGELGGEEIEG